MNEKLKKWIYQKIGYPEEVQNLLNYLDEFEGNVAMYPAGRFEFGMMTSDGTPVEPLVFNTPQERAAFGAGVARGVAVMGGPTGFMTQSDMDEFNDQEVKASHKVDPKKMN